MRTSFHHQPEAQHPNFQLSTSWKADYPIFRARSGSRLLPMIRAVQAMGFKSNASVAAELNARKVPTARGKEWTSVCPSPVI